ncbi:MAG: hypothetical protein JSW25_07155 [Thermoplasmata archaeon]|nr:MAG: hypothetical protein JSW25_07155 [Thermoplasmata archaeon]
MREGEQDVDASAAWASTVNVSREPVRSNAVPVIQEWAAGLVEALEADALAGATVAMRQMDHIVATCEGADLAALDMDRFVEVVEYDPVRHVAMVIGTRDAPRTIPLVWLALRVFPGAEGVVVVPSLERGEVGFLRSAVRGSFDEAFAVGEQLSSRGREGILGPAATSFERVGTILVVPPGGDPAAVLGTLGD